MKYKYLTSIILSSLIILTFPIFFSTHASSDFGCTLDTSNATYSRPTISKPAYLSPFIDPIFSSKITRIVSDSWGSICRHHYSKDQPWNADQSVIWMNKGCDVFIDGTTYSKLSSLKTPPDSGGESRWHPTDPNIMIYTSKEVLGKWNPFTGKGETIATFPGYSNLLIGMSEGNLSADGKMIALYSTNKKVAFAYDLVNKIKYPDINLSSESRINSVSMSYTGKYIQINVAIGSSSDSGKVFDLYGNVQSIWPEYGCPSHYDFTIDQNGDDVAVGTCKTSTSSYKGIIKRRLSDGKITQLFPMGASHTSARNLHRLGWVYVSQPYYSPFVNEILAIKVDGSGTFERFAWVPNQKTQYEAEPHAVPSLDGKRIITASNWSSSGGLPIQDYVVEACPDSSNVPPPNPTKKQGDANDDGKVDYLDYLIWFNHFNQNISGSNNGDFNNDNMVNGIDYIIWLLNT